MIDRPGYSLCSCGESLLTIPQPESNRKLINASYLLLPPFYNVSHSSISHIYIDVNESTYIYMSKFINNNINVGTVRMAYIVKWRDYMSILEHNIRISIF